MAVGWKKSFIAVLGLVLSFLYFSNIRNFTSINSQSLEPIDLSLNIRRVCGYCENKYVQKMSAIHPDLEEIAYRSVCLDTIPIERVSNRSLIFGAGPDTTATRTIAKAVNFLGFRVLHAGILMDRNSFSYPKRNTEGCADWHDNLGKFGAKTLYNLLLLKSKSIKECADGLDEFDFRRFDHIDGLFDAPLSLITYRLLKFYPNSKVIFTDRDPYVWYEKRSEHPNSLPAIQTPCLFPMKSLTVEQNASAYEANLELLRCLLPPDRFLVVNVWEQDPEEIFINLAEFLEREAPPPECKLPFNVNHCLQRDDDVERLNTGNLDACMQFQKNVIRVHYS